MSTSIPPNARPASRSSRVGPRIIATALVAVAASHPIRAGAQQPQNPSPMVEHSRAHPRLAQQSPPGTRRTLELGTLYLPDSLKAKPRSARPVPLLVFFHGGSWLPEVAARSMKTAVVTIQLGAGSGTYAAALADPERFPALLRQVEAAGGVRVGEITLGGWSAGCGAIRELLQQPDVYARVGRVLAVDGIHTSYPTGKPGPQESTLDAEPLQPWLALARDAIAKRKRLVITHSEIFPGTFASTTETVDWLVQALGLRRRPVLAWGPMGTQQLSEVRAGHLRIAGYAGNSAPDHVEQLHALPALLKLLK
jgi:acetyl esterase/lipase